MDRKIYRKPSVALLALLTLSIILGVAPKFAAAETLMTDRPLYAIKWKDNVLGYVNVTVTLTGLDPETRYEIAVSKFHGPAGLNYVREVYGVYEAEIKFTIPPTMDSRPEDIAGTWNATLYKVVGETKPIVTWVNFGVWAINSKVLNYGRILQLWGGGFKPTTKVNFTVYDPVTGNIITDELFGEDPARSPVSGVICVKYGTFSNTSDIITTAIPKATYVVELKEFQFLPKVLSPGAPETTLEFRITDELIVNILKPADGSKWRRTDTVPVEVEVLYQDLVPVTSGEVKVTFTPPKCTPEAPPYDKPKTISLSYSPVSKTWIGNFKIQKNNSTGDWGVSAYAEDFYGNSGSDSVGIIVRPAILVVETEVAPPASVPRASWVSWLIKVTYKGDGSPAKLYIPLCTIYAVNATTNATVGSAYLVEIEVGRYNVTWFVPADAPLGDYRFLIPADALKDNVTICGVRNTGPEKDVLSPIFAVGITALRVEVKTYSVKYDTTKERIAFTPGSMVYIGAKVTYMESGVVMSAGSVRAYIYNETGYLIAEIPMSYHSDTRMWWCEWDSTGYPAGRYRVLVKARDIGYNVGEGETYFYISGLVVSPKKGTVPPIENTKCEKLKDGNWLITATVYTDPVSGKSLGTVITISATHFTPNSKVNVTVDWLPYPAVADKKILLAMNIPTDAEGNFATTVVFPTTVKGIYYIIARDAKGLEMKATFEVTPGMILTPDPVVGSSLTKVIATGLPGPISGFTDTPATAWEILVNDTDALRSLAGHIGFFTETPKWRTNANGTLISVDLSPTYSYSVKPGFVTPFIEPGAYSFKLILEGGGYRNSTDPALFKMAKITSVSDSVKVVNAFKEFTALVDKVDYLIELVSAMNVKLASVDRNVAKLVTDTGIIKADVSALKTLVEKMGGTLTDISGGIATIKTDVGTIKASVDALSPKIEAVRGDVAKISTSIGDVTAKLSALEPVITGIKDGVATVSTKIDTLTGKVTTIDGNVATVRTDVGDIKATVANLAGVPGAISTVTMAVWIAVILSLVAAICSIVSLVQLRKKIAG
jgi:outer membrane murein-binding lipoprotein Lpp